jgi:hypothetical protein
VPLSAIREQWVGTTTVRCHVDADVVDISRRLREGDSSVNYKGHPWLGDDTLTLHLGVPVDWRGEPADGDPVYEVWGVDAQATPYLVLRWPRADATMLVELIKGDSRVLDVVADIDAANAKLEADRKAAEMERLEEAGDRLHFALRRDQGQHFGGLRKRIY